MILKLRGRLGVFPDAMLRRRQLGMVA
jgi:hypothetical protein